MTFKQFKEEMAPSYCHRKNSIFGAGIKDVYIYYDKETKEFQIHHKSELLLDGADLRTAKAFVKLMEKENGN